MNARLVRHVLYPLHERVLRRPTFGLLAELERTQWLSGAELRRLQTRKLRRLLLSCADPDGEYRRTAAAIPADPRGDDPRTFLSPLPLRDKQAIRRQTPLGRTRRGIDSGTAMSTGGSTGEPLTFLVDRLRRSFDKAARMRTHRWFDVEPGDKEVYLWGAPLDRRRQEWRRAARDFLLNDLLLSAFDLSPARVRQYLRQMRRFDPTSLFGYPSSLAVFADLATANGDRPHVPSLKAVFATGEMLEDPQRRKIASFFGAPVVDGYGGRDFGFCAHECPQGRMHVTSEHVIVEIIDDEGRPRPLGESGEIVVTNLDNRATPFIRYRTGDVGRIVDEPCPCGRGLEVMHITAGRRTDHLVADDGSLRHALSAIYVLRETPGVRQFQIRQRADRSVEVRVVADGALTASTRSKVLAGVQRCVGQTPDVRLREVDQIPVQPSGKFRHVISEAVSG